MSRRNKSRKGHRFFSSARTRVDAQICLHEAAHAVTAVVNGIEVALVFTAKGRRLKERGYVESFIERRDTILSGMGGNEYLEAIREADEFVKTYAMPFVMGASVTRFDIKPTPEELMHVDAPRLVEFSTGWTDKTGIPTHIQADQVQIKTLLQEQPDLGEHLKLLNEPLWMAELKNMLALQPIRDAIEAVGMRLEADDFVEEPELLKIVFEKLKHSLTTATCVEDFLVETHKGRVDAHHFGRMKMKVIDLTLPVTHMLLRRHWFEQEVNTYHADLLSQRGALKAEHGESFGFFGNIDSNEE